MSRSASYFAVVTSAVAVFSIAACSAGEVAVGSSDQRLQYRKDGQPTGNGQTCSWDDTVAYDSATGKETTTPVPNGPYKVGDHFKSLDGCNDCSCTKDGITCTERACNPDPDPGNPQACTEEAKQCPDGSYVVRTGPNCEFAPCPGAPVVDASKLGPSCADDFNSCPAGQYCYWFRSYGYRCASDPCAALTCPANTACRILESFPVQIECGQ